MVDRKEIFGWAEDHPEFDLFLKALSTRKKSSKETELESFLGGLEPQAGKDYKTKRLAIAFFRELQRLSLGEFKVGRKKAKTRFIWRESLVEFAQSAISKDDLQDSGFRANGRHSVATPTSKWCVQAIPPLDYFFTTTLTVEHWLANLESSAKADAWIDFMEATCTLVKHRLWDWQLVHEPHVAFDARHDTHYFIFKVSNNGTTFLVTQHKISDLGEF